MCSLGLQKFALPVLLSSWRRQFCRARELWHLTKIPTSSPSCWHPHIWVADPLSPACVNPYVSQGNDSHPMPLPTLMVSLRTFWLFSFEDHSHFIIGNARLCDACDDLWYQLMSADCCRLPCLLLENIWPLLAVPTPVVCYQMYDWQTNREVPWQH